MNNRCCSSAATVAASDRKDDAWPKADKADKAIELSNRYTIAILRTGSTGWKMSVNLSAVEMRTKLTFRRAHDVSFHLELPTHEEFLRIRITRD